MGTHKQLTNASDSYETFHLEVTLLVLVTHHFLGLSFFMKILDLGVSFSNFVLNSQLKK